MQVEDQARSELPVGAQYSQHKQRTNNNNPHSEQKPRDYFQQQGAILWEAAYLDGKFYLATPQEVQKLRDIQMQLDREKARLQQIELENDDSMDKSFHSQQQEFLKEDDRYSQVGSRMLQLRQTNAQKELQIEEEKYRERIKQMQKKKAIIKKQIQTNINPQHQKRKSSDGKKQQKEDKAQSKEEVNEKEKIENQIESSEKEPSKKQSVHQSHKVEQQSQKKSVHQKEPSQKQSVQESGKEKQKSQKKQSVHRQNSSQKHEKEPSQKKQQSVHEKEPSQKQSVHEKEPSQMQPIHEKEPSQKQSVHEKEPSYKPSQKQSVHEKEPSQIQPIHEKEPSEKPSQKQSVHEKEPSQIQPIHEKEPSEKPSQKHSVHEKEPSQIQPIHEKEPSQKQSVHEKEPSQKQSVHEKEPSQKPSQKQSVNKKESSQKHSQKHSQRQSVHEKEPSQKQSVHEKEPSEKPSQKQSVHEKELSQKHSQKHSQKQSVHEKEPSHKSSQKQSVHEKEGSKRSVQQSSKRKHKNQDESAHEKEPSQNSSIHKNEPSVHQSAKKSSQKQSVQEKQLSQQHSEKNSKVEYNITINEAANDIKEKAFLKPQTAYLEQGSKHSHQQSKSKQMQFQIPVSAKNQLTSPAAFPSSKSEKPSKSNEIDDQQSKKSSQKEYSVKYASVKKSETVGVVRQPSDKKSSKQESQSKYKVKYSKKGSASSISEKQQILPIQKSQTQSQKEYQTQPKHHLMVQQKEKAPAFVKTDKSVQWSEIQPSQYGVSQRKETEKLTENNSQYLPNEVAESERKKIEDKQQQQNAMKKQLEEKAYDMKKKKPSQREIKITEEKKPKGFLIHSRQGSVKEKSEKGSVLDRRSRKSSSINHSAMDLPENSKKNIMVEQKNNESKNDISREDINRLNEEIEVLQSKLKKVEEKQEQIEKLESNFSKIQPSERSEPMSPLQVLRKSRPKLNLESTIYQHKEIYKPKQVAKEPQVKNIALKEHKQEEAMKEGSHPKGNLAPKEDEKQYTSHPNQKQKEEEKPHALDIKQKERIHTDENLKLKDEEKVHKSKAKEDVKDESHPNQKLKLKQEIGRLKKIIRELQMQKIKSIEHDNHTIISKNQQVLRPDTYLHIKGNDDRSVTSSGVFEVKRHSNQSQLLRNRFTDDAGKIIKNSPEKFHDLNPEKVSRLRMLQLNRNISLNTDNDRLLKDANDREDEPLRKGDSNQQRIYNSQTRQQILNRLDENNRDFQSFVESSRIIHDVDTKSNIESSSFSPLKLASKVQNSPKQLWKHNSEQIQLVPQQMPQHQMQSIQQQPQQHSPAYTPTHSSKPNFSRLVEEMRKETEEPEQQLPQVVVRGIEKPELPEPPTMEMNQDQLLQLAKRVYKLFNIDCEGQDKQLCMRKYKNCVIFSLGSSSNECVIWHYSGKFYLGGWKTSEPGEGEKTGQGFEYIPGKHVYKGQFLAGKKHGTGISKLENGSIYDGQWIQGVKNGRGCYLDALTNVVYSGQWKNGKKDGFGFLKFSSQEYYLGTFVRSVKEGHGTQIFVNGDKYKGEYRNGKFHGKGRYTWANGSCYDGHFVEGIRNGLGSWKSAKKGGDIYIGSYENDRKSGEGRYIWANGCIYQGSFSNDVKHGHGKLIHQEGKEIKGIWEDGNLMSTENEKKAQKHEDEPLKRSMKISSFQIADSKQMNYGHR